MLARIDEGEAALIRSRESTRLPERPDSARVEAWLVSAQLRHWGLSAIAD